MNNFKTVIGVEIHAVINSKTKMFSSSLSDHNSAPNTNINEVDLALPGSMPTVNKNVVYKAIKLASALNMQIEKNLMFDRKNYFYQDLPKGFQITQQFFPIGTEGYVIIKDKFGHDKKISIERIHIEEDTAKKSSINNVSYLDYNRAGMPLIEIVSKPQINDEFEIAEYLKTIKRILNFIDVSDAKMEEGSMRADINISHNLHGSDKFGCKVEIKNINSISNAAKAVAFERERQIQSLLLNEKVSQETRRWDDSLNQTIFMREKSDAVDYKYFTEPNILQIQLSDEFVNSAIDSIEILPNKAEQKLRENNFDQKMINAILDDVKMFNFINELLEKINTQQVITWFLTELSSLCKDDNCLIYEIENNLVQFVIDMISLLDKQEINSKQAKVIIQKIYSDKISPEEIIKELGFVQIKDPMIIKSMLEQYIENNVSMLEQYNERPERVEKLFLGLLMKETKGQANPNVSIDILRQLLTKK